MTQPPVYDTRHPARIHFIAIGGAAMHNVALALHLKGHHVTGSDDQIHEPSRSRLSEQGLMPEQEGWFPSRITGELDVLILGMHARPDNPELKKAQMLGLDVVSRPSFCAASRSTWYCLKGIDVSTGTVISNDSPISRAQMDFLFIIPGLSYLASRR